MPLYTCRGCKVVKEILDADLPDFAVVTGRYPPDSIAVICLVCKAQSPIDTQKAGGTMHDLTNIGRTPVPVPSVSAVRR